MDDTAALGPVPVLPPLTVDAPATATYPLLLGEMEVPRWTLYANGGDTTITVPLMSCLIIDGDRVILVDNGYDLDYLPKYTFRHTFRSDSLLTALRAHGVEYGDVDLMVNTHLHADHAGMNRVFENAKIVLQRAELQFAHAPNEQQSQVYRPKSSFLKIPDERFWLVDGNVELSPSVWLVHTPGHTPGHQSVLSKTASGWVIFPGDACHAQSIFDGGPGADLVTDTDDYARSLQLIRDCGFAPIFAHDIDFVRTVMKPAY